MISKSNANVLEIPGGEIIATGGNCEAIAVQLPGDRYLMVTSAQDGGYPPSVGDEFVDAGIYRNGEWEPLEMYEAIATAELFTRLAELTATKPPVDG